MWKGNGLLWNKIQEGEGNIMSDNINKFDREIWQKALILDTKLRQGGISPFIYLSPFLFNL